MLCLYLSEDKHDECDENENQLHYLYNEVLVSFICIEPVHDTHLLSVGVYTILCQGRAKREKHELNALIRTKQTKAAHENEHF